MSVKIIYTRDGDRDEDGTHVVSGSYKYFWPEYLSEGQVKSYICEQVASVTLQVESLQNHLNALTGAQLKLQQGVVEVIDLRNETED